MSTTTKSGVYEIKNTENGHRYVGSSVNIGKRWGEHANDLRNNSHHSEHLQRAWNKYRADAFEFRILVYCEPFELLRYEQAFINRLNPEYNCSHIAGSTLGFRHSNETKKKMSESHKNLKPSAMTRIKLSAAQMGNKKFLGRHHSQETREKISTIKLGKKRSPFSAEWKAKIRDAQMGKRRGPLSAEHRAKISATKKGIKHGPLSEEWKAKISTAKMGHFVSAETRAKLRATWARRKATQKYTDHIQGDINS